MLNANDLIKGIMYNLHCNSYQMRMETADMLHKLAEMVAEGKGPRVFAIGDNFGAEAYEVGERE
jgi:hypothetical protein